MKNWIASLLKMLSGTIERPSPGDWVSEPDVQSWAESFPWLGLNVHLAERPKIWVPMIPDTNSMDGVFDYGHNNILIAGSNDDDHQALVAHLVVGDIAVYRTSSIYAIHRIIEIGDDAAGRYYRFKGDNNSTKDPEKIRESQIEWVSIGTIY